MNEGWPSREIPRRTADAAGGSGTVAENVPATADRRAGPGERLGKKTDEMILRTIESVKQSRLANIISKAPERMKNWVLNLPERYHKLPVKQKLIIGGVLYAAGIGASMTGAGLAGYAIWGAGRGLAFFSAMKTTESLAKNAEARNNPRLARILGSKWTQAGIGAAMAFGLPRGVSMLSNHYGLREAIGSALGKVGEFIKHGGISVAHAEAGPLVATPGVGLPGEPLAGSVDPYALHGTVPGMMPGEPIPGSVDPFHAAAPAPLPDLDTTLGTHPDALPNLDTTLDMPTTHPDLGPAAAPAAAPDYVTHLDVGKAVPVPGDSVPFHNVGAVPDAIAHAPMHADLLGTVEVHPGDNLTKILTHSLSQDPSFAALQPGAQTNAVENLIHSLRGMTPAQLHDLGFTHGGVDNIHPGDHLHLEALNDQVSGYLDHAQHLTPDQVTHIEHYQPPVEQAPQPPLEPNGFAEGSAPFTLADDAHLRAWLQSPEGLKLGTFSGDMWRNMPYIGGSPLDSAAWKGLKDVAAAKIINSDPKLAWSAYYNLTSAQYAALQKSLAAFAAQTHLDPTKASVENIVRAGVAMGA